MAKVGTTVPNPTGAPATVPFNNYPGQWGDGYSWIVQVLPYMEEGTLYQRITQSNSTPVQAGQAARCGLRRQNCI